MIVRQGGAEDKVLPSSGQWRLALKAHQGRQETGEHRMERQSSHRYRMTLTARLWGGCYRDLEKEESTERRRQEILLPSLSTA